MARVHQTPRVKIPKDRKILSGQFMGLTTMKIVVGLGNPGAKYQNTRHNVGFEVLGVLAQRWNASTPKIQFEAEICDLQIKGVRTLLVAPQTYMNLSGRSVGKLADFYKLAPEVFAVLCDDMDLQTGRLRWRAKGSAGGQKGLLDITRHLSTQEIARLRIGIGRPPGRQNAADYVLGRFSKTEREEMDIAVQKAADSVELWLTEGTTTTMNKFNQKPAKPKKAKPDPAKGDSDRAVADGKSPTEG